MSTVVVTFMSFDGYEDSMEKAFIQSAFSKSVEIFVVNFQVASTTA